ncbi:MAG: hypothetical protein U1F65_09795 [Verrucomicrobiota bacterium]
MAAFVSLPAAESSPNDTSLESRLQQVLKDNAAMRSQMQKQQELIEQLSRQVARISDRDASAETRSEPSAAFAPGKVRISGEGAAGFFSSGSEGMFPNSEFRVDEAKLFLEAPVWGEVYSFFELNLAAHEAANLSVNLGEAYLDFENVSKLWGREEQVNLRLGRLDVPFGEEYLFRDADKNPLISHSLVDFWDVDEGIELYGSFGKWRYVAAVMNGGVSGVRDFTSDKAVVARLSCDPAPWLHLSVSGMRTGDLNATRDGLSAVWFGGGWFRSLGSTNTTHFYANLVEGDVELHWRKCRLKGFGGYVGYDDNDPLRQNHRDVYYYSVEGTYDFNRRVYGAARFSQIFANHGFPVVGNGTVGKYLFGPLTENIWRLSLGLGYRWNSNLSLKAEYTLEQGRQVNGAKRNHADLFAAEAAFAF